LTINNGNFKCRILEVLTIGGNFVNGGTVSGTSAQINLPLLIFKIMEPNALDWSEKYYGWRFNGGATPTGQINVQLVQLLVQVINIHWSRTLRKSRRI
jgi:hypothetical protein